MHLPSLSESKLFFLLFSASYYPGVKNNKEFTALDLELGQVLPQIAVLPFCAVSAECLLAHPGFFSISTSLFPRAQYWDAVQTGIG